MSEEQEKRTTNITREELYRQVWATPMSRLGTQYGVSGNGLKKICDRLNVPYPPRGYWAKLSAGKSVRVTPLPKPLAGTPDQVTITPTPPPADPAQAPELDPDTGRAPARGTRQNLRNNRTCHAEAAAPGGTGQASTHPAIAAWVTEHEREIAAARRDRSRYGFPPYPLLGGVQRFSAP